MNALTMRITRDPSTGLIRHMPILAAATAKAAPKRGRKERLAPDPFRTNGDSAAEELRLLIERAERIREEITGAQDDLRDVFAEAKSRGYDAKAIRDIMAIRTKDRDAHAEHQSILETYMVSLGML